MNRDHHVLWELAAGPGLTVCFMVDGCAGVELQVRVTDAGGDQIILREHYPDRGTLYERARGLRAAMQASHGAPPDTL